MSPVVRYSLLPCLLTAALVAASGCEKKTNTTPDTTGTTPTQFQVTETFTGTIEKNGAASYSFSVSTAGTVYVTLTKLEDPASPGTTPPNIGISLGTWNGTSCSVQTGIFTDNASQNASIAGQVQGAGVLCARVYDPASRVSNPLSYTITVVHP